jgi:hypothetical protein
MSTSVFAYTRKYFLPIILAVLGVYSIAAYLTPNRELLIFLRAIQGMTAFACLAVIWPTLVFFWRDRYTEVADQHVFTWGGVLVEGGIGLNAIWLYLWRMTDAQPLWMVNSPINGFFLLMISSGLVMQTLSPGAIGGRPARANIKITWIAAIVTGVVLLLGWYFDGAMAAFLEWLRPYAGGD